MRVTVPVVNGVSPVASYLITEGFNGYRLKAVRFAVATGVSITEAPILTIVNKSNQVVAQAFFPVLPAGVTVNCSLLEWADHVFEVANGQAQSAVPSVELLEGDFVRLAANDPAVSAVSNLVLTLEPAF